MNQSGFLVVALALLIALAGGFAALLVARAQARLARQRFQVRLTNDGNAPSQYEIWAEPVGGAADHNAVFEFRQGGVLLASSRGRAATSRPADSRRDQPPEADLAAAARDALGAASSAAAPASSWLQGVTDVLGDILPAEAGSRLRQWEAQARAGQAAVDRVDRNTARYRRLVSSGAGAMVTPRPAAGAVAELAHQPAGRLGAVQTPALAPGQSLALELTVRPAAPARTREVWFVVCARSLTAPAGDAGAAPVQIEASAYFGGASGVRFYLPYAMIFLVALALIVLVWIGARGM